MNRGRGVIAAALLVGLGASCTDDRSASWVEAPAPPAVVTSPSTAAPVIGEGLPTEPAPAGPLPGTGESTSVVAIDNTFRPEQLEVLAGTEVVFTNSGRNEHDIIPADQRPGDDLAWGAEADDFVPRDTYRVVFEQPGTYDYYCSIHGTSSAGMIGTITVTG